MDIITHVNKSAMFKKAVKFDIGMKVKSGLNQTKSNYGGIHLNPKRYLIYMKTKRKGKN